LLHFRSRWREWLPGTRFRRAHSIRTASQAPGPEQP
jgi:hypothetical protein